MLANFLSEATFPEMRSKMKISKLSRYLLLLVMSAVTVSVTSCEDEVVVLPPESSEEDQAERVRLDKAKKERSALKKKEQEEFIEMERKKAEFTKNAYDVSAYTKEELLADTKMDPHVRDALLQAKKKMADKKKARADLMKREMEAKRIIEEIDLREKKIVQAKLEYDGIIGEQRKRELSERDAMNAEGIAPAGMVWIPGGKFKRGNDSEDEDFLLRYAEEYPEHVAEVSGFYMDATEVTVGEFAEFVKATGYKTMAERGLDAEDFPEAKPEDLKGGSNVFKKTDGKIDPWVGSAWRWWAFTPGATWKTPEGPNSSIENRMNHPVSCVNYDDAMAYAKWAGKRLPTEAEWERAARADVDGEAYTWGDEMKVGGKWMANVYQGEFPTTLEQEDGFLLTAPVKSYPPNHWGLYDMAGNVWEICSDFFHPGYYYEYALNPVKDPKGPVTAITDEERMKFNRVSGTCPEPRTDMNDLVQLRVVKGGSFLCSSQYCLRFRPAARHHHEPLTPSQHMGFRCVKNVK